MRPSLILDVALDVVFRTALLFSLFLLFAGHNAPGGGFVSGLVAGTALVLRYVAGGVEEVDRVVPVHEQVLLGCGLLLVFLTGVFGWVAGGAFLYGAKATMEIPVLGTLSATSALVFDIGVDLVVIGLVLALVRSLGAVADRDQRVVPGDEPDGDPDGDLHADPDGHAHADPDADGSGAQDTGRDGEVLT